MKKGSGMMEEPRACPRMGSGGIPQRETCLAVCPCQWYPPARDVSRCVIRQSFTGHEKSRDEPCFCMLARLFGRKTSEIIQASFTPELGIVQLMVKPVLNLLPALFIDEGLNLLPNTEEVLDLTDTAVIAERHFL